MMTLLVDKEEDETLLVDKEEDEKEEKNEKG
jgi:hypothetical protein